MDRTSNSSVGGKENRFNFNSVDRKSSKDSNCKKMSNLKAILERSVKKRDLFKKV